MQYNIVCKFCINASPTHSLAIEMKNKKKTSVHDDNSNVP